MSDDIQTSNKLTGQPSNPLTSCAGDSPASLFPMLESAKERQTIETSGLICSQLSKHCDLLGCLEKMLLRPSDTFAPSVNLIWKPWVIESECIGFRLVRSERSTNGKGHTLWPTATSRDWKDGSAQSCQNVPVNSLLGRAVHQLWRTPQAGDGTHNHCDAPAHKRGTVPLMLTVQAQQSEGKRLGSLNPTWVEWLMGFPLGWTDLEASATL